jgi:uncharacterized membrane protein HdeD (DUF308 family)
MGILYVITGLLVMREPAKGSIVLTLFVIAGLFVGGVVRIMIALQHRHLDRWWLLLAGGLISVILAVILAVVLYGMLPWSGLWILGTLIAVELLVQGVVWINFGFALRALARSSGS